MILLAFIDIPTEQTTAVTDVFLALVAIAVCLLTLKAGAVNNPKKGKIWGWAFGLLAFAAITGAVAHGFQMSKELNYILWQPLNLALGLTVSLFVVGVFFDLTNGSVPKYLLPLMISIGTFFYLVTLIFPGSFLVFILYEAAAMLFSLVVYIILSARHRLHGASLMAAGILITIVAAAIQATEVIHFRCIWEFNHNGIFHLVQTAGLIVLYQGLRSDLLKKRSL
jgi:hypothetical protein